MELIYDTHFCIYCACFQKQCLHVGHATDTTMHAGVVPQVNPSSDLFSDTTFQYKDLFFNLSGSKSDAQGLPYAFHSEFLSRGDPGFLIWLPMDQPEAVFQHRLQYLEEASFLGSRAHKLTLDFAAVDMARLALAYVKVQFVWLDSGAIHGETKITSMPVTTMATTLWVCILPSAGLLLSSCPWLTWTPSNIALLDLAHCHSCFFFECYCIHISNQNQTQAVKGLKQI
jgi:hypothetical protein